MNIGGIVLLCCWDLRRRWRHYFHLLLRRNFSNNAQYICLWSFPASPTPVWGIKLKAPCVLGKRCTTDSHPSPNLLLLICVYLYISKGFTIDYVYCMHIYIHIWSVLFNVSHFVAVFMPFTFEMSVDTVGLRAKPSASYFSVCSICVRCSFCLFHSLLWFSVDRQGLTVLPRLFLNSQAQATLPQVAQTASMYQAPNFQMYLFCWFVVYISFYNFSNSSRAYSVCVCIIIFRAYTVMDFLHVDLFPPPSLAPTPTSC